MEKPGRDNSESQISRESQGSTIQTISEERVDKEQITRQNTASIAIENVSRLK
jgi:hypothetical protein